MRKGINPAKLENNKVENHGFHQIIVPVYLPKLEDYFAEGLEVLKLCLESIYLTVHDKTYISVVNNGSCQEVRAYLDDMLEQQKIQEVIHTTAIGKINAIAKGLSGHHFDLVTITDADVLFTNGWQKAVYEIYETFPKAGMVGTTPNSKIYKAYNEMFIFDTILNPYTKFRKIKDPKSMENFILSTGYKKFKPDILKEKILSVKKNNALAYCGTGHFTFTIKEKLIKNLRSVVVNELISPRNDAYFIDKSSSRLGHWRLSTAENYTYHMGNVAEKWMYYKLKNIKSEKYNFKKAPNIKDIKRNIFIIKVLRKFSSKIIRNKFFSKKYKIFKGLNNEEASKYI